jgi:hypothetical protein
MIVRKSTFGERIRVSSKSGREREREDTCICPPLSTGRTFARAGLGRSGGATQTHSATLPAYSRFKTGANSLTW